MEPGEKLNPILPKEGSPNPNPQLANINVEIDVGLRSLRTLVQDL
jgi:hypothetical protein